jgi:alkaline phosphatase D
LPTRRQFVTSAGSAAAAAIFAPQALAGGLTRAAAAPLARGGRFRDGVMAGEPTPTAITLWSRVDELAGRASVDLEVARDRGFRQVVAHKRIATSGAVDHNVKARVTGLKPYEQYYYRFATRTQDGPVGRFRTALPPDSQQPVKFAFYSCQDYTHGYYNAHELMARDDLDFVVCLGDYIYAETYHARKDGTAVRDDRIGSSGPDKTIVREAVTLADYREKYRLYRSDKSLQKVQAKFPVVMLWDDHEVQNNYAGGEPDGGLPPAERYSNKRKRNAYKAFFEAMPYFAPKGDRIYRRLSFGKTVDLIVMDQRQYRANQPCNDAVAPACADWDQPRNFLGRPQMDWVKTQLRSSPAAWKVMANEVMMMPAKVLNDSFYSFDSWQGYPREREELLTFIESNAIKDVVFVTGDIHTFIAGDVRTQMGTGNTVALEFVGGSITSQSLGETSLDAGGGVKLPGNDRNPHTDPNVIGILRQVNPWVDQADFDHHGYGRVTATQQGFDCELVRLQTIKKKTTATVPATGYRWQVARGQTSIKGVNGPPS